MKNIVPGPARIVFWIISFLSFALASDMARGRDPYGRPMGHGYHAMAYDSGSQQIILFGGQTGDLFTHPETFLSSDTWAFDPTRNEWQRLNLPGHPPGLTAHAMAYDQLTKKTVLYGGLVMDGANAPRLVRETWAFDFLKKTWKRVSDGPSERYGHRMVSCPKSGTIILFGGARVDAATKNNAFKLAETWAYEAAADRWKDLRPSPSPSPRHYFGMVYDSQADRVIVWGGAQEGSADASSVWAYDIDSNTWSERKPAGGPESLSYVAMAYDPLNERTIVYGGKPEGSAETWAYDYATNTWERRFPKNNPGPLSRMPLLYAPTTGRAVLFGGQLGNKQFVYSDKTWSYDLASNSWEDVTVRRGDYLGQKKPGSVPEIFLPGLVSTTGIEHSAPAFSPDGKTVLWIGIKTEGYPNGFLLEMKQVNGVWIPPQPPSFADPRHDDFYGSFSRNGSKFLFSSRRPLPSGLDARRSEDGMRIWVVARNGDGWGVPVPLDLAVSPGDEYAHSVSANGTLYFSSNRAGSRGSLDLYRSRWIDGAYQPPEHLDGGINTEGYEDGPFIAPDESYLIFESRRPEGIKGSIDLYICFRRADGSWTSPANMGPGMNTEFSERFARLSPDGKFLFFGSNARGDFDIYWVDARIIEELRSKAMKERGRP